MKEEEQLDVTKSQAHEDGELGYSSVDTVLRVLQANWFPHTGLAAPPNSSGRLLIQLVGFAASTSPILALEQHTSFRIPFGDSTPKPD